MKYNEEHLDFIRKNIKGTKFKDLTDMFNKKFNTNLSDRTLAATAKRYGYKNGVDCRFKKGHIPNNKGTKGLSKANKTSFRKGHIPINHRPVGSERVNIYGYIEIKVKEPATWRYKHIVVWEKANNRKVPKGHVILFLDKNKLNCDIENLLLINRKELLLLNRKNILTDNVENNKCCVNLVRLEAKIAEKLGSENSESL